MATTMKMTINFEDYIELIPGDDKSICNDIIFNFQTTHDRNSFLGYNNILKYLWKANTS